MKSFRLLISNCHANCTKCGMPTEFRVFESGFGDFSTYLGKSTQSFYRVDVGQIHYLGKTLDQLLSSAIEREGGIGNLVPIPEQLQCKLCTNKFSTKSYAVDSEEMIDAYTL
jgi:hypothetical protein